MTSKFLNRLINKLGQNVSDALPSEKIISTQTVSGSPPNFVASNYYPLLVKVFNSRNVTIINNLANVINQALYYTSNGKIHLPWMYNTNFNFDSSIVPSTELKNLMNFSKAMSQYFFYNLTDTLSAQEVTDKVKLLLNNQSLLTLPQTSTSSQLTTKIGGDLKTIIKNYLLQIK